MTTSVSGDDLERRKRFAQGTLALQLSPGQATAASIFNMALTNALVAIAVHARLPSATDQTGRLPSASQILRQLEELELHLPCIEFELLRSGISSSDAARHGHAAADSLTDEVVAALAALDAHPALRCLEDAALDRSWLYGEAAVGEDLDRALRYLALLDEDEQQRRIQVASEAGSCDLKDHLVEPDPQECPVCGHETLLPEGGDGYGYGVVVATCFVCSYHQSEHETETINQRLEFKRRWDHE